MNWASTAASGMNNGPNSGKSLAEIQAEEEEHERRRQERERQQKKERQKEMGLAQVRKNCWTLLIVIIIRIEYYGTKLN